MQQKGASDVIIGNLLSPDASEGPGRSFSFVALNLSLLGLQPKMTLPAHACRHGGRGQASRWKTSSSRSLDVTELSHTQHTGTEFGSVQGILFLKVDNLRVLYGSPALLPLCTSQLLGCGSVH